MNIIHLHNIDLRAKVGGSPRKSAYPMQRTIIFEADKRVGITPGNRSG